VPCIYLLHFDRPLSHARHYVGYTDDPTPDRRIARHRQGRGSKLMAAVVQAGITFSVARVWSDANRDQERQIKKGKNAPKLCPICRQQGDNSTGVSQDACYQDI
jgi:predicted GIY-YIG superfamily endonuclease